jgi:hypothetical protein
MNIHLHNNFLFFAQKITQAPLRHLGNFKSIHRPLIADIHLVKNVEDDFKVSRIIEKVNLRTILVLQITIVKVLTNPQVLVGIVLLVFGEDLGVGRGESSH